MPHSRKASHIDQSKIEPKAILTSIIRVVPNDSPLAQLLSGRHDNAKHSGFITRLDRSPISSKRTTFLRALLLNAAILVSLVLLAAATILHDFYAPYPASFRLAFILTQDVFLASAALVLLRSTLIPFFFSECPLRYTHGFPKTEIIIRRLPRALRVSHLLGKGSPDRHEEDGEGPNEKYNAWRVAVARATDPALSYYRLGALLSPEYWMMEYGAVLDAYKCVQLGTVAEEDLDFAVWERPTDPEAPAGTWMVADLWRLHDPL